MPTRRTLVIEIDVTGWDDAQIASLDMHVSAQFEAPEDDSYPAAEETTSRIIDEVRDALGLKRPRVEVTHLSGAPDEVVTRNPEAR